MRIATPARVILRHVDGYDVAAIRSVVRDGLEELDLRPHGRTLVKPNLVATGELFRHAHTRAEFVEGVLLALEDRSDRRMTELAVGERSGITIPTRYCFAGSGVTEVTDRLGIKRYCFEETQQVEIELTHSGRLRDRIFVPEPVARADFFVNCPKFKAHPWTTVTFSMKNYIGLQDDRHRLIDHDHALNRKIADLQHVIQPEFVAIDAIIAGEGRMLTPTPRTLNLVVMGNNQPAVDAVCSQIIGVDPASVEHIRLAHQDGFGPIELERIAISGDVTLAQARERAKGFEVGLVRVEKYFSGSKITAYAGPPPGHGPDGYCWGGCPGAMEEAIEVIRLYDRQADERMPRLHFVFGAYQGPIDVSYGEKVVFVGDCVSFEGKLGAEPIQIKSRYRDRSTVQPKYAEDEDIYAKMLRVMRILSEARDAPYLRLPGCPVSCAELILVLAGLGKTKNPYLDLREILSFNRSYLALQVARAARFLEGNAYMVPGLRQRGDARPEFELAIGSGSTGTTT
jgi:uncharacterized protein (DUF362 family)